MQNPLLITDFQHALANSSRHANNLTVSSTNTTNVTNDNEKDSIARGAMPVNDSQNS